jgi:hypothetical protein
MVNTGSNFRTREREMTNQPGPDRDPELDEDILGSEAGGTDELGPETGGTDILGSEAGGTDELGPETGGTDILGTEAGGTDILGP